MRRCLLLLAVLFAGCSPSQPAGGEARSAELIVDQAHNGGRKGFFFLPPMVSAPTLDGTFAALDTRVQIDERSGEIALRTLVTFPSGAIAVGAGGYSLMWDTGAYAIDETHVYRVRVFAGDDELGFADVQIFPDQKSAKRLASNDFVGLVDGKKLNIKYWTNASVLPPPVILVAPASVDFGTWEVGQLSEQRWVSIGNKGASALTVTQVQASTSDFAWANPAALPVQLQPGNELTVALTFTPSQEGAESGELQISSSDPAAPVVTVALAGTGVQPPPDLCAGVVCQAGACQVAGQCDPATGICSNPVTAPNGSLCDDGNACTQVDVCIQGVCLGGNPRECPAPSGVCRLAGACNAQTGLCEQAVARDGTPCSDGNACTEGDTCQAGACTGRTATAALSHPLADGWNVVDCGGFIGGFCDVATVDHLLSFTLGDGRPYPFRVTLEQPPGSFSSANPSRPDISPLGPTGATVALLHADGTPYSTTSYDLIVVPPAAYEDFDFTELRPAFYELTTEFREVLRFDAATGQLVPTVSACDQCAGQPDGTPCSDGSSCTIGDVCNQGVCTGGPAPVPAHPEHDACNSAYISPRTIDFANTSDNLWSLPIFQSDSSVPVTIYGASISGPQASAFTVLELGGPLPATVSFTDYPFLIAFNPTASGDYSATLTIQTDDPNTPQDFVKLIGHSPPP